MDITGTIYNFGIVLGNLKTNTSAATRLSRKNNLKQERQAEWFDRCKIRHDIYNKNTSTD